jgi:hypothetical protein
MENITSKIEKLEKELAELKQEVTSVKFAQVEINSVEDAFELLNPEWYIYADGDVGKCEFNEYTNFEWGECNMTSEKRAKQIKALIQLHLVAEAMNMGAKREEDKLYFIDFDFEIEYTISGSRTGLIIPTFNTRELAEEALEKFEPLFKDLYMLND